MNLDRTNIDQAIADRIAADPEFRSALLNDPRAALSDLANTPIPESIRITVHEESMSDIHLVIPSDANLSESDLELVAGGASWHGLNYNCDLCGS